MYACPWATCRVCVFSASRSAFQMGSISVPSKMWNTVPGDSSARFVTFSTVSAALPRCLCAFLCSIRATSPSPASCKLS